MESVKAESEKLPETSEEVRQQEKRGTAPSSMLFVKKELNGGAHFSIFISTDLFKFFILIQDSTDSRLRLFYHNSILLDRIHFFFI